MRFRPRLPRSSNRNLELGLLVLVALIVSGAYALTSLGRTASLPANVVPFLGFVLVLLLGGHLALRRFAPLSDGTLFPTVALLNGIGYVFVARLRPSLAAHQAEWTAIGIVAFVGTLYLVKRARDLQRYRYTFAFLGLILLMSPLVVGTEINGARNWIRVGSLSFQPSEVAKITLAIFFASYLVEKRELLALGTRRLGPVAIPDFKHFAPIIGAWLLSLVIMTGQKDLGSSLLLFSLFVVVLFVVTGRAAYLFLGTVMLSSAAWFAYQSFGHVRERVATWLDPWAYEEEGYQLAQGFYAMGSGGVAGSGLGLGDPTKIPIAYSDFIFAAIGEELGLLGTVSILIAYLAIVGVGLRIAMRATNPFEKLLATTLTAVIGLQSFIIIAGVIRIIPLTGVTLPWVSYGGSSLVTNYVLLALLLRISNDQEIDAASGVELGDEV